MKRLSVRQNTILFHKALSTSFSPFFLFYRSSQNLSTILPAHLFFNPCFIVQRGQPIKFFKQLAEMICILISHRRSRLLN